MSTITWKQKLESYVSGHHGIQFYNGKTDLLATFKNDCLCFSLLKSIMEILDRRELMAKTGH